MSPRSFGNAIVCATGKDRDEGNQEQKCCDRTSPTFHEFLYTREAALRGSLLIRLGHWNDRLFSFAVFVVPVNYVLAIGIGKTANTTVGSL